MAGRGICLDWFRLSRGADSLRMALDQLAVWHRRYVRLPQGEFLLLQSLVGIGPGAAPISPLELGSAQWRADFRVGALECGFGGGLSQRKEPGIEEDRAPDAS